MYYPRGYAEFIEPLARDAGIADHIVYGMVREESYFDPRIASSAGAVGLSQLMPSTAASVAQRLHIVDPDLRDPATNLAIGVRSPQGPPGQRRQHDKGPACLQRGSVPPAPVGEGEPRSSRGPLRGVRGDR